MNKIEIRSTGHRKVPVADILPNPHRDLDANPILPEKVEGLIESYERTGFWDNIVVREHPTLASKFELAYGHARLTALKDKRVVVDTITIPVAKLTDWEMYCAMVDENELAGKLTTAMVMENINVGCDLIEYALEEIGPDGTWVEFNKAMGRVVPTGTPRGQSENGHGFEQVRKAFHEGEGIGRGFLVDFLPGGHIRHTTISEVVNARYGASREKAKAAKAAKAKAKADEIDADAEREQDAERKAKKKAKAKAEREKAEQLAKEAARIGKGVVSKDVLLMFDTPNRMTDFAAAVRRLEIPKQHHVAAAQYIISDKIMHDDIYRKLSVWWDEASGASAERRRKAKAVAEREKLLKKTKGRDYVSVLLELRNSLKKESENWKIALAAVHLVDAKEKAVIEQIAELIKPINALVERSREVQGEVIQRPVKMLSHRR